MLLLVERGHGLGLTLPFLGFLLLVLSCRLTPVMLVVIHLVVFIVFEVVDVVAFHEWYWVKLLLV